MVQARVTGVNAGIASLAREIGKGEQHGQREQPQRLRSAAAALAAWVQCRRRRWVRDDYRCDEIAHVTVTGNTLAEAPATFPALRWSR
jgi:hypothetical protein